jgi:spermidine synthase
MFSRTLVSSGSRFNKKIEVIKTFGTTQLLVDGIVQTGVYTHKLFENGLRKLIPWHHGALGKILVFGIGGGGIFRQLHEMYPATDITGVDVDSEIVRISKKYFQFPGDKIHLIVSDAKKFAESYPIRNGLFDLVIIDIYIGNDVPEFVTSVGFLKSLKRLLRNNGSVMLNYFSFQNQPEKSAHLEKVIRILYSDVVTEHNQRNVFYYFR